MFANHCILFFYLYLECFNSFGIWGCTSIQLLPINLCAGTVGKLGLRSKLWRPTLRVNPPLKESPNVVLWKTGSWTETAYHKLSNHCLEAEVGSVSETSSERQTYTYPASLSQADKCHREGGYRGGRQQKGSKIRKEKEGTERGGAGRGWSRNGRTHC